ncbi:MAG: hypothetical protein ACFNZZ_04040 [Veillonella parvula]
MATKEMPPRAIILSEETAELFDCKKMLDGFYDKIVEIHDKHFCIDEEFSDKFLEAYGAINALVMGLLSEAIDINSTNSHCKVI